MFNPKMIENENTLQCFRKHNHPITSVILDPKIEMDKRFLCDECLKGYKEKPQLVKFQSIILEIEQEQNNKAKMIENTILTNIKQVEIITSHLNSLRFQTIQLLDGMIITTNDWIEALNQKGRYFFQYSIIKEIDNFINQVQSTDLKIVIREVMQINHSWIPKINTKLNQFLNFNQYSDCKQAIDNLQNLNVQSEQFELNIGAQTTQKDSIRLSLIDSFKQGHRCRAITFDQSGQIMVTSFWKYIKIWKFNDGKFQQVNTLEGHTQSQELHTDWILNMILNKNEDLLFSGSRDCTIKVWNVNFTKDLFNYLYTLNKHTKDVDALSLNQSETSLVSCGLDKQIIIWMKGNQDIFEFKYVVKQSVNIEGCKVKFLNDEQFIWVTGSYELDQVFIFELKDGEFQENKEKTIQLKENNEIEDQGLCPIIYSQGRNIIFLRHKTHIYLIRETKAGIFSIAYQLYCETYSIDGGITNNAKYLVFWDYQTKKYSHYLIEYL